MALRLESLQTIFASCRWRVMIPESLSALLAPIERHLLDELRANWQWRVGSEYQVVGMTAMGDWLFADSAGAVHLLETVEASFDRIADDMAELVRLSASDEFRDDTFLEGFALGALAGGQLPQNHCVGFKVPPILGGKFDPSNLQVAAVGTYQTWTGRLHEARSKVPDGGQVLGVDVADDGSVSVRWQSE